MGKGANPKGGHGKGGNGKGGNGKGRGYAPQSYQQVRAAAAPPPANVWWVPVFYERGEACHIEHSLLLICEELCKLSCIGRSAASINIFQILLNTPAAEMLRAFNQNGRAIMFDEQMNASGRHFSIRSRKWGEWSVEDRASWPNTGRPLDHYWMYVWVRHCSSQEHCDIHSLPRSYQNQSVISGTPDLSPSSALNSRTLGWSTCWATGP